MASVHNAAVTWQRTSCYRPNGSGHHSVCYFPAPQRSLKYLMITGLDKARVLIDPTQDDILKISAELEEVRRKTYPR